MIELLEKGDGSALFPQPITVFKNIYDFSVISRLNIPIESLPENVEFINKPESFYDRHRQIIVPSLSIIVLLSIFLLLLLQNLVKQKTINRKDRAIISLNKEIIETQRELVTILGEVIENHSMETGNHVKRVAKISRFLGMKVGLSDEELELLEAASPLHDVGKIGISEMILHKPGRLTGKEFEIIKEHTTIGRDILRTSNRQLLASACSIAYQHHERWDGSGYPNGLKGQEIDVFARITMLADIYDALSSERSYKKAWSEGRVLEYIRNENRKFFDPRLVAIFLENIEEIRAIRQHYGPSI
jgi:response regulator RpfG family c-di-GMP phosphodiesterase